MDRVAVGSFEALKHQRNFNFQIAQGANTHEVMGAIATFYFPGPPNLSVLYHGTGYYAIKVWGSGYGYIFEYGWSGSDWRWFFISSFGGEGTPPTGVVWHFNVEIIEEVSRRYPFGGFILTTNLISGKQESPSSRQSGGSLALVPYNGPGLAQGTPNAGKFSWACLYSANSPEIGEIPDGLDRPRADANRNSRPGIQIVRATFVEAGSLVDGDFKLPFVPVTETPMKVSWSGTLPSGCSITSRMFRSDNNDELTPSAIGDFTNEFDTIPGVDQYYLQFDFAGPSTTTPTLSGFQVVRDGYSVLVAPGEFELEVGPEVLTTDANGAPVTYTPAEAIPGNDGISITQPGADPSVAIATFSVNDLTRVHDRITNRARFTSRIETAYDPEDPELRCILHRGEAMAPNGFHPVNGYGKGRAGGSDAYASGRVFWSLTSSGMWEKLNRAISPVRFDWGGPDFSADELPDGRYPSYKATDAVRGMLIWAGFPREMTAIPDLPLRLYASNGIDFYVEPLSSLADMIQRIVRKYLGMRLVFEENAGAYGKWRLLRPTLPPYTPLLHFTTEGSPSMTLPHTIASYPQIGGRPVVPVRTGTLRPFNIPLEANRITVTASGYLGGSKGSSARMTQTWHNFKSFNFLNLDESHANFPDPLHPDWCPDILEATYVDPGLYDVDGSGKWVRYALKRIAAIAGHTVRGFRFQAPLPLIDIPGDDEMTGKVRMPRYYDACTFNGTPFLVRDCNPRYTKDGHQFADFEIEAPREDYL